MGATVVVIGLGHLGRRYLQGLLMCRIPLTIWAVDRNSDSLQQAQVLLADSQSQRPVHFSTSIKDVPSTVDLAICATTADARVTTLRELQTGRNVRYVILEKLVTQSIPESAQLLHITSQMDAVWVNYPRRIMTWHQYIRERVIGGTPIQASVNGATWGLVTNGLHFIDLLEWWSGSSTRQVRVLSDSLHWFESQRPGFYDATGTMVVTYEDGSSLTLHSSLDGPSPGRVEIEVWSNGLRLKLAETDGIATGSMLSSPSFGRLDLQSELSGRLTESILVRGCCGLPTLDDVLPTHNLFLSSLLPAWRAEFGTTGPPRVT